MDRSSPSVPGDRGIGRAVLAGAVTALGGAGLVTILGTVFALSAGLLVVAFFVGRFAALAADAGAGAGVRRERRLGVAVGFGVAGVGLGQLGLWLAALAQGGTLDAPTFLAETYGPLVPAQLVLAAAGAWWPLRR
jgi:hypothetical protein